MRDESMIEPYIVCFYVGVLAAEMIKKRKNYYQGIGNTFLKEVSWPQQQQLTMSFCFVVQLINYLPSSHSETLRQQAPRFTSLLALERIDVLLLNLLRSGIDVNFVKSLL